jgi:CAAX protease family protein
MIGLIVALAGGPALVVIQKRLLGDNLTLAQHFALQLILSGMAAFVVLIVVRFEHLPLRSIGLRKPTWATPITAALLVVVAFVLQPRLTAPLVKLWGEGGRDAGVATIAVWPAWFRLFVALTSGIVEETLYRGYAVERLIAVTGRTWLGAVLAMLAFGAAHIPAWGAGFALTNDLAAGVVLVLIYVWRRDLIANILAHTAGLLIGLFSIPL